MSLNRVSTAHILFESFPRAIDYGFHSHCAYLSVNTSTLILCFSNPSNQPKSIRSIVDLVTASKMPDYFISAVKRCSMNLDTPTLAVSLFDEIQIVVRANVPRSIETVVSSREPRFIFREPFISRTILTMINLDESRACVLYLDEEQIPIMDPPITLVKAANRGIRWNGREGSREVQSAEIGERRILIECELHKSRLGVLSLDNKQSAIVDGKHAIVCSHDIEAGHYVWIELGKRLREMTDNDFVTSGVLRFNEP